MLAVKFVAPFYESEQLDLQPMLSGSTSKPVAPQLRFSRRNVFYRVPKTAAKPGIFQLDTDAHSNLKEFKTVL